jgi:hypothetical protein
MFRAKKTHQEKKTCQAGWEPILIRTNAVISPCCLEKSVFLTSRKRGFLNLNIYYGVSGISLENSKFKPFSQKNLFV